MADSNAYKGLTIHIKSDGFEALRDEIEKTNESLKELEVTLENVASLVEQISSLFSNNPKDINELSERLYEISSQR